MTAGGGPVKKTGLIIALDHSSLDEAASLAARLSFQSVAFKVGLTLFTAHGPEAIRRIVPHGRVFCDLKLHDIPEQVAGAAAQAARLGVWMLSIHASGGPAMVRKAAEVLEASGEPPILAAVTVLTSLSSGDLAHIGQDEAAERQVLRLARLATGAGATAIVCSPLEVTALRRAVGREVLLVAPGVRPVGSARDDQSRVTTPAEAARAGADYVVVGRPITGADEPEEATRAILAELYDAAG